MKLVVNGCAGRMGQALTQLILADARVELVGGLEAEGSDALGQDVAGLAGLAPCGITASDDALTLLSQADAVIDFTVPSARLSSPHWRRRRALSILSAQPALPQTMKKKSPLQRAMRGS